MATRVDRQRAKKNDLLAVLAIAFTLSPALSFGENHEVADIKPFGLLDVSGRFRAAYLFDDRERGSDPSTSFETRSTWEQEFFLLTKSFVYHPGFLNMEVGGGLVFVQQQFDATLGENSDNDTLFNYLARLSFLELKNYPFSVYYERSHPSITTSLAGRFLTQNDTYGLDGRIFGLLGGSTSIRFGVGSRASQGSSSGWVVDDDSDSGSVLIQTSYRDSDSLELKYDSVNTLSASGSPGLPIQQSEISSEIGEISSRNWLGGDDQFEIYQVLRRLQQETEAASSTALDDRLYQATVRWQMADKSRSYVRYRQYDTRHTFSQSESQNVELGLVRQANEDLSFDSALEYTSAGQTGFSRDVSTLRGSVNYTQDVGFGTVGLAASLMGSRTDQESSATEIQVFDEAHVLNGTTPINLDNEFVVAGSVVVSNAARTQVFVEGFDYRLVVVGSVTSLQRLITGNIGDGETVVVDYSYETSGTAEFDSLGAGFSVNVGFLKTMNAYVRYDAQDTNLRNGEFTNPVNDRNGIELGIVTSNQFLDGWTLSGQYRHRDQDEEISPFVSDTLDLSVTTNLRGIWKLTVATGLHVVDFENSSEDINLVSYRVGLSGRLFRRTRFVYDVAYLDDDGGSLPRELLRHRLDFQWAYRQVRFVLRALVSEDMLGNSERNDTQVTAQIMRVF